MRTLSVRRDGFTLVEVLAAFAILALAMTGLFVAAAGAMRADARSQSQAAALRLASSHLASLGTALPIISGSSSGNFGPVYEWEQVATPIRGNDAGASLRSAHWITLTVRPAGTAAQTSSHSVTLTTLKIAGSRAQDPTQAR